MRATSRAPKPSAWPSAVVMFVDGTVNTVCVNVNGTDGCVNGMDGRVNGTDGRVNDMDGRVDGHAGRVKSPVDPVELSINGFFSDLLVKLAD